ncbi:hypothetical protein R1sor_011638 [Riccia sorocarpa]|uniref:Uncharacterized protein n=1 Tax=Riccia sorocarpa TaxID=122646 RepID=A0ABD3I1G2_9MARC
MMAREFTKLVMTAKVAKKRLCVGNQEMHFYSTANTSLPGRKRDNTRRESIITRSIEIPGVEKRRCSKVPASAKKDNMGEPAGVDATQIAIDPAEAAGLLEQLQENNLLIENLLGKTAQQHLSGNIPWSTTQQSTRLNPPNWEGHPWSNISPTIPTQSHGNMKGIDLNVATLDGRGQVKDLATPEGGTNGADSEEDSDMEAVEAMNSRSKVVYG